MATPFVRCLERDCSRFVTEKGRCAEHQKVWVGSTRAAKQPKDWALLRDSCFKKYGYTCYIPNCADPATEVDHVDASINVNRLWNLRPICLRHHRFKSALEGNVAQGHMRAQENIGLLLRFGDKMAPPDDAIAPF